MRHPRVSAKIGSLCLVLGAAGELLGCASSGGTNPPNAGPSGTDSSSAFAPTDSDAAEVPGETASVSPPDIAQEDTPVQTPASGQSGPEALPLPQGTKVLHVGDSFAGALGLPLSKQLEAAGVRSILKHTDSSYLTTWAWEKDLQDYLWKFNPDLVIVTLGANELAISEPEQRERTVKKIISTIGDRPCLWVAIPLWNGKQNGLMDVIERSVSPCVFMDTNELIDVANMPRISDGIHPASQARDAWADFVFNWLKQHRVGGEKPWTIRP